MAGAVRFRLPTFLLSLLPPLLALLGCSGGKPEAVPPVGVQVPAPAPPIARPEQMVPIMLGIDTLESTGFAAVKGKRLGLLTHPAGVNRRGVSTIEVLRKAPGVNLVALYAVEHGIYNEYPAEKRFPDQVDARTGLMVYSLYNPPVTKATPAQLRNIDALVVDLQDIGTRSYTFVSAMKQAMIACFENNKELIVLDRPNPLGGLKVSGPLLDPDQKSYVGAFRVPYVHGLTLKSRASLPFRKNSAPAGGSRSFPCVAGGVTCVGLRPV
jgi:uncharacterized protein YbbC (DUF1343 family)